LQDQVEVRHLTGEKAFPPGLEPAFAFKSGYLLVASSPEAIRTFHKAASPGGVQPMSEVPLLRLSLTRLRQFFKDRRESLISYIAEKGKLPIAEVDRKLKNVLDSIELLDRVELTQQTAPEQHSLILHVRTTQPLRRP